MIHILDSPLPIGTTAASSNRNFVGPRVFIFNDERRSTYHQDIVIPFIITFPFFFVTRLQNPYIDFSCHNRGCDHILTSHSLRDLSGLFGSQRISGKFRTISTRLCSQNVSFAEAFVQDCSVRPAHWILQVHGRGDLSGHRAIYPLLSKRCCHG